MASGLPARREAPRGGNFLVVDASGGALSGPVREFDLEDAGHAEARWASLAELIEDVAEAIEQQRSMRHGWVPRIEDERLEWDVAD